MGDTGFGPEEAKALLASEFAPWVQEMGLVPLELGKGEARFSLPPNPRLQLTGGPGAGGLCGQAIAAVADTATVLALAGANGRFRMCTTVDMQVNFVRPLGPVPADVTVAIESNGRKLAVARVRITAEGSTKAAALAALTFMYLED